MVGVEQFVFPEHGDDRGSLIALEEGKEISFPIKRVYYIYGTGSDVRRGFHAHRTLEQVLVCLHGSCKILVENKDCRKTVLLDAPNKGLYIGPGVWREMYDFSGEAVLIVLASQLYDEGDYIRDHDEFLRFCEIEKALREGRSDNVVEREAEAL